MTDSVTCGAIKKENCNIYFHLCKQNKLFKVLVMLSTTLSLRVGVFTYGAEDVYMSGSARKENRAVKQSCDIIISLRNESVSIVTE